MIPAFFIYKVEENERYLQLADAVFAWIRAPRGRAVTSTITMLELLVKPYRISNINRVNQFYALLSTYPHPEWIEPTLEVADRAARLRAEHNLRTPDALQAATALACRATGFISNDTVFHKVGALEVVILNEVLAGMEEISPSE